MLLSPLICSANEEDASRKYTFSWPYMSDDIMKPRGGTTQGDTVTLDLDISNNWYELQKEGVTNFERDRLAILSMQGPYRVSFDFIETMGFVESYSPSRPYQSWGTEFVYLLEDRNDFISLQHILVMFFDNEEITEPVVVKHWRQDWHYEDTSINEYRGFNTWQKRILSNNEVKNKWSQSVYQVDDSPRYQSIGEWKHNGNYSNWLSSETWRPLPRREFSIRDDYDVLIGTNRHVITPYGWVQEENNLKSKLDNIGEISLSAPIVAKESGIARYERIIDHDWSKGDIYWQNTKELWSIVRSEWKNILDDNNTITIENEKYDNPLFLEMINVADVYMNDNLDNPSTEEINNLIEKYLVIKN